MHPSSSVAQILARLNRNSEGPRPYVPGCTSVLKGGASNSANEEVKVKPSGILLLYTVIGEMGRLYRNKPDMEKIGNCKHFL